MFGKLLGRRFVALTVPSLATAITLSFNHKSEATGLHQSPAIDHSNVVILSGTANLALSRQISDLLQTPLLDVTTKRFSDGEINCVINESIRGKDVFIIQTCAAPVNDNVMELLLTVAAARRAGANTVTTVIPYFGYKYHRRGLPISTTYSSRFLWNSAGDLAKMLQTVGVDNVLSVDLQRPGQGHEACFFDCAIPVETVSTNSAFAEYFKNNIHPPLKKVVIVSANTECVKKARKFQRKLKEVTGLEDVEYAVFMRDESHWTSKAAPPAPGPQGTGSSELLGEVAGADVIIIDDIVDTAAQLSVLCRRIKREGAGRVFICASHGLFTGNSTELINLSPVEKVVVTDSVPLPKGCSHKIAQVSIAPLLARVIETERTLRDRDESPPQKINQIRSMVSANGNGSGNEDDEEYVMDEKSSD